MRRCPMKLNVMAFAVTCALVWGLGVFALAWWVIAFDGTGGTVPLLGLMYRGFTFTPKGSVIGLAWALPDGLILGALVAAIYNRISGARTGSAAS
jgi:hypothetical protein